MSPATIGRENGTPVLENPAGAQSSKNCPDGAQYQMGLQEPQWPPEILELLAQPVEQVPTPPDSSSTERTAGRISAVVTARKG